MSVAPRRRDGYYDDTGRWKRTKFCARSCGDRCTCSPPLGKYYRADLDKSKAPPPSENADLGT